MKTLWLCRNQGKRIRLLIETNADGLGVDLSIEYNVPERGGNAAQKRENDKKLGAGTITRAGAQRQCCPTIMKSEDIRYEGKNGRLGQMLAAVIVDGSNGKEYRLPTEYEQSVAEVTADSARKVFDEIPFGVPDEQTPKCGPGASRAFSVDQYGFDKWSTLFTNRQLVAHGVLSASFRRSLTGRDEFSEGIYAFLAAALDRFLDYNSNVCNWDCNGEYVTHTFQRFALPIK